MLVNKHAADLSAPFQRSKALCSYSIVYVNHQFAASPCNRTCKRGKSEKEKKRKSREQSRERGERNSMDCTTAQYYDPVQNKH